MNTIHKYIVLIVILFFTNSFCEIKSQSYISLSFAPEYMKFHIKDNHPENAFKPLITYKIGMSYSYKTDLEHILSLGVSYESIGQNIYYDGGGLGSSYIIKGDCRFDYMNIDADANIKMIKSIPLYFILSGTFGISISSKLKGYYCNGYNYFGWHGQSGTGTWEIESWLGKNKISFSAGFGWYQKLNNKMLFSIDCRYITNPQNGDYSCRFYNVLLKLGLLYRIGKNI
jgi:hypothetical protein